MAGREGRTPAWGLGAATAPAVSMKGQGGDQAPAPYLGTGTCLSWGPGGPVAPAVSMKGQGGDQAPAPLAGGVPLGRRCVGWGPACCCGTRKPALIMEMPCSNFVQWPQIRAEETPLWGGGS